MFYDSLIVSVRIITTNLNIYCYMKGSILCALGIKKCYITRIRFRSNDEKKNWPLIVQKNPNLSQTMNAHNFKKKINE